MLLDEEIWLWRTLSVPAELIEAFTLDRVASTGCTRPSARKAPRHPERAPSTCFLA